MKAYQIIKVKNLKPTKKGPRVKLIDDFFNSSKIIPVKANLGSMESAVRYLNIRAFNVIGTGQTKGLRYIIIDAPFCDVRY